MVECRGLGGGGHRGHLRLSDICGEGHCYSMVYDKRLNAVNLVNLSQLYKTSLIAIPTWLLTHLVFELGIQDFLFLHFWRHASYVSCSRVNQPLPISWCEPTLSAVAPVLCRGLH